MARTKLPSNRLLIREGEPNDFDSLVEMVMEMSRFLSMEDRLWIARDDIPDRDPRRERLRDALFGHQRLFEALILEVEGHPAGFCTFHTSFSTYRGQPGLFLEDLFVRESFQKRGLGKQLMAKLAKVAKDRGCYRIVWNVPADDEDLQRFYKGLGAREVEEWTMILHGNPLDELALSAADWTKKPK